MWKEEYSVVGTKTITVQHIVTEDLLLAQKMSAIDQDAEMKYQFARKLTEEIFENELMILSSDTDSMRGIKTFSAQITVAEPAIKKCVIDTYEYQVEGIAFTHKDIVHAVKNWKPELFL